MPVTVRIDDDVAEYFKEFGKFGESHSDVLRRLLPNFRHRHNPEGDQEAPRIDYPTLFGYSLTSVLRALGAHGWTEEKAKKALQSKGIPFNPLTVRTQIAWGKQWGKRNPACKRGIYGSEPPTLTPGQLAELQSGL